MTDNSPTTTDSPPGNLWKDGIGHTSIRAAQILLILALISVSTFALIQLTLVVIPILIALILTAAIAPVVSWLTHRGFPKLAATSISFLAIIATIATIITAIVFAIKSEWDELISHASDGFDELYTYIEDSPLPITEEMINDTRDGVVDFLTSSTFGNGALNGIGALTSFLASFVLLAVVLFFFLKDGARIWSFFLDFIQGERKRKATLAGKRTMEVFGGYIRGTAAVAAVDAVCTGIALVVLGVPLALPLAVLTFIGGFIPIVGATAAGTFAVLIALVSEGPTTALIVLIVVIAVNQLEGNLLQPVLMGNALQVHGLVVLLALTIGAILAGVIGAILSVPLAAAGWAIIKVWTGRDDGSDDTDEHPVEQENDAMTNDHPIAGIGSPNSESTGATAVQSGSVDVKDIVEEDTGDSPTDSVNDETTPSTTDGDDLPAAHREVQ